MSRAGNGKSFGRQPRFRFQPWLRNRTCARSWQAPSTAALSQGRACSAGFGSSCSHRVVGENGHRLPQGRYADPRLRDPAKKQAPFCRRASWGEIGPKGAAELPIKPIVHRLAPQKTEIKRSCAATIIVARRRHILRCKTLRLRAEKLPVFSPFLPRGRLLSGCWVITVKSSARVSHRLPDIEFYRVCGSGKVGAFVVIVEAETHSQGTLCRLPRRAQDVGRARCKWVWKPVVSKISTAPRSMSSCRDHVTGIELSQPYALAQLNV